MKLYFSKWFIALFLGGLLIIAGVYSFYLYTSSEGEPVFRRAVYAITGIILYVGGTTLVAPPIIRTLLDRGFDSFTGRAKMTEPPEQVYDSAREAIKQDEYEKAKKMLFAFTQSYPKALRPYQELIDMLHVDDAQFVLKQAKQKLKSDEYQSLVDKIWEKRSEALDG